MNILLGLCTYSSALKQSPVGGHLHQQGLCSLHLPQLLPPIPQTSLLKLLLLLLPVSLLLYVVQTKIKGYLLEHCVDTPYPPPPVQSNFPLK